MLLDSLLAAEGGGWQNVCDAHDSALAEIILQVANHCTERGALLQRIRKFYLTVVRQEREYREEARAAREEARDANERELAQTERANKLDTELQVSHEKLDALRASMVRLKLLRTIHGRKLLAAELKCGDLQREIDRLLAEMPEDEDAPVIDNGRIMVRRRYREDKGSIENGAAGAEGVKRTSVGNRTSTSGADSLAAQLEALRALLAEKDAELAALRAAMADYQMQLTASDQDVNALMAGITTSANRTCSKLVSSSSYSQQLQGQTALAQEQLAAMASGMEALQGSAERQGGTDEMHVSELEALRQQARIDYEKEMEGREAEDEIQKQDFGEFVEDRFMELYGLKKVAHDHLRDFIKGIKNYSDRHKRLKIFRVLTGLVPKDDENDVSLSDSAARFYRLGLRFIADTAAKDHIAKLKGAKFWTHYARMDVIKFPVLYFEQVSEKMEKEVKKIMSEAEGTKARPEGSRVARQEVEAIRAFKAFEAALQNHADGKLDDLPDVPAEDGSCAKVFQYGDPNAARATAEGTRVNKPICVDCFLDRALEHYNEFELIEEEQLIQAFGSWDKNGDGYLALDEFTDMVRYSNPEVGQRKVTRAFATASGGGDYVDKERLASALLSHGLTLTDCPEGGLEAHRTAGLQADGASTAAMREAAPTVANTMAQIGTMTHAMRAMGYHEFMRTNSEEEAMASLAEVAVDTEAQASEI